MASEDEDSSEAPASPIEKAWNSVAGIARLPPAVKVSKGTGIRYRSEGPAKPKGLYERSEDDCDMRQVEAAIIRLTKEAHAAGVEDGLTGKWPPRAYGGPFALAYKTGYRSSQDRRERIKA